MVGRRWASCPPENRQWQWKVDRDVICRPQCLYRNKELAPGGCLETRIEFQPSGTSGEGCHRDIGLSAFDRIVMHTGIHGFQDVVSAQSEGTDVKGCIG